MSLGTLTVDLLMKTGKFETDTKRAEKRATQMAKNIDKNVRIAGAAFATVAATGLAAFAVGIKSAIDNADEMGKMAQKIGVTTEALSGLSFAASQSEVEVGQLQKALAKVSVDLVQSNSDLRELGITATTSDAALIQLADVFVKMPDGLEKTALAAKLFGERIGPDLIPLLNLGAKGIEDLKGRAEELGIVISDEMAADADRFNDTMDEVKGAMQGAFLTASNDLLPIMQEFASFMASSEAQEGIKNITSLLTTLGQVAFETLSFVGSAIKNAQDDLTVAVNGQLFASDQKLKRQIESAKSRLAQLENFAPGVDTPLKNKLRDEITALKNQQTVQRIDFSFFEPPKQKAARPVSNPAPPKVISGDSGKSGAASASRSLADDNRAAEESARALAEANDQLNGILDAQSATIGGALVSAAQDYRDELVRLDEIEGTYSEQGKLTLEVQNDLNLARQNALDLYQQETEAIQNQKTPAEEDLQRMRDELKLMELSNIEREKAIYLLNNPTATPEQAGEYNSLVDAADELGQTKQAMDEFRSSAENAFESFLDGSKSAEDAFEDFADSIVAQIGRILAQQLVESLFGGLGGAGGGTFGGGIGSFFGSLFGGGKASGGAVNPGRYYRVNENGPEVLSYQGKDFLMMGSGAGMVKQNTGGAHVTINLPPGSERRTAQQAAQRAGEETQRALARNR